MMVVSRYMCVVDECDGDVYLCINYTRISHGESDCVKVTWVFYMIEILQVNPP